VTGAPLLAVTAAIVEGDRDGVFVDSTLDIKLIGGGEVGRAVGAMLELRGREYEKAPIDKIRWFLTHGDGARYHLVLAEPTYRGLSQEFALESSLVVEIAPGQVSRSGESWGLYSITTAIK
jgi:hypothetical protein